MKEGIGGGWRVGEFRLAPQNTQIGQPGHCNAAPAFPSAVKTTSTAGRALDTYAYQYDAAGIRLGQQINDTVTSAAYNNLNQITSVSGVGPPAILRSPTKSGTSTPESVYQPDKKCRPQFPILHTRKAGGLPNHKTLKGSKKIAGG